ncbi:MAG: hypothetical protein JKY98_05035 [Gammaproteobacteria bacterium]|nr:hypothetical protein [Gammaproteobacteria bacterium]
MTDIKDTKEDDWEETEEISDEISEAENVMRFSDFVEPQEKHLQKQRITELRRRAEERQDWKRIIGECDLEDDALEEA